METNMKNTYLKLLERLILSLLLIVSSIVIAVDELESRALQEIEQSNALMFDGVIEPNQVVDVGSAAEGIISAIHVDRSDVITAGQELAKLESHVELATLELARTQAENQAITDLELRYVNHEFNKRKKGRANKLYKKKAISYHLKDEAETEAQLSRLQLRQAADNKKIAELEFTRANELLNQRTVKSPISGVVVERFKAAGEYAEDEPIIRVAELNPLRVEIIVPADLYGVLHTGMQAKVLPESQPNMQYKAEIKIVDKVIDAASGTFGVRLMLDNPDYKIPGGLKCKVQFSEKTLAEAQKSTHQNLMSSLNEGGPISFAINPYMELSQYSYGK